jgi:ATP-dependent DNA ligase
MWSCTFLDDQGRPSFNLLQNYGAASAPVVYFVFDVMVLGGQNVMGEPLSARRELLEKKVLLKLTEPVRYTAPLDAALPVLIESVKAQGSRVWWPNVATAHMNRGCDQARG